MNSQTNQTHQECVQWSNRILIASLAGIFYLTLFPFRIDFAAPHPFHITPFLLGTSEKVGGALDVFLNVLLFVPFGFGLAAHLRKRGSSRRASLLLTLAAGAITSYVVEFLQLYIETRDSGWWDIISNTSGAVAGFFLFDLWGEALLKYLTGWGEKVRECLSLRRTTIFLVVYLVFFFTISVPLQKETRLNDWDTASLLFVGSDGTAKHAWRGQISRVQIWDRAIAEESARKLTAGEPAPDAETGLLASYEFAGQPPYEDQEKFLPGLAWISSSPPAHDSKTLDLDGSSWLTSSIPAAGLTQELKKTNQFAVRAICTPADVANLDQRIVSISKVSEIPDLTFRREGAYLVFWFRNPLSVHRSLLSWYLRDIFAAGQVRDILVSYDGSDVSIYVDGKKEKWVYYLSPGAALVHKFKLLLSSELDGYLVTYDALIFVPAGLLLGVLARKPTTHRIMGRSLMLLGLLLPSLLFEFILVQVSGRPISAWQVSLTFLLTLLGVSLMNADRHEGDQLRTS